MMPGQIKQVLWIVLHEKHVLKVDGIRRGPSYSDGLVNLVKSVEANGDGIVP